MVRCLFFGLGSVVLVSVVFFGGFVVVLVVVLFLFLGGLIFLGRVNFFF